MKFPGLLILFFIPFLISAQELKPHEGFVKVKGGKVWYKVVGEGKGTPLMLIHGGPGDRSCSGIPVYSQLATDRSLIFYDQLGTGNSEHVWDPALWKPARFADEIDSIRKALHLKELIILGHSWGGSVLVEYLSGKPAGVKAAIFASPLISTSDWMADANILLAQMPKPLQDTIRKYEQLKKYFAPAYLIATDSFYARYLERRKKPGAEECNTSGPENDSVYNYMWGPNEFKATGTLKNFDRSKVLPELKMPVLFIAGEFDEARPQTMKRYSTLVKQSRVVIIPDSGHNMYVDQPILLIEKLSSFLNSVDR